MVWFSVLDDYYHARVDCHKLLYYAVFEHLDEPRRMKDGRLLYSPCEECVK